MRNLRFFDKLADEPFRLFFPFGMVCALLGVLYWPLSIYGLAFTGLPMDFHVWMQIYGFLWAFIIGFLATALPRLTQTKHFTKRETALLFVFVLAISGSLLAGYELGAHVFFLISVLTFVICLAPRFQARQKSPPVTFIFIPFAFVSIVTGTALMLAMQMGLDWRFAELYPLARNLITQAFVTFLLLGVGGFLIRSILGWGAILPSSADEKIQNLAKTAGSAVWWHGSAAIVVLFSFVLEAFFRPEAGRVLRAVLISAECLLQMKIYKLPISGKITSKVLLFSLWLFVAGLWGYAFCPQNYRLAFLHLCFIGGFSLSTIAVATRVILSHCGYGTLLNRSYKPFTIAASLMLAGLLARFAADFLATSYQDHLAFAGLLWGLGALVWSFFILSKAILNSIR